MTPATDRTTVAADSLRDTVRLWLTVVTKTVVLWSMAVTVAHGQIVHHDSLIHREVRPPQEGDGRPVTVTDVIGLSLIGSRHGPDADVRSPDGRHTAFVLQRGDIATNTNVYTLVVFRIDSPSTALSPDTILAFATASNRSAIAQVHWLDSRTIAFLGEQSDTMASDQDSARPQVFTVDIGTRRWKQETRSSTAITGFDIASGGDPILYTAEPLVDTTAFRDLGRHGFPISKEQVVGDLVRRRWATRRSNLSQLFLQRRSANAPVSLPSPEDAYRRCWDQWMSVSPTGTTAVLACMPKVTSAGWTDYVDPYVQLMVKQLGVWPQYLVLDLGGGGLEPLFNAPTIYPNLGGRLAWAPNGRSVVVGNAYLPLDTPDVAERAWRASHRAVAEVDVHTHVVSVITRQDSLDVVRWDPATNTVVLAPGIYGIPKRGAELVYYRKTSAGWREVRGSGHKVASPLLRVDEGMNDPPSLVAVDPMTNEPRVILDPNPGLLKRLRFGREVLVHWTAGGAHWDGGLYLPPDFDSHRRYPLVIQTHDFDSTAFWPDGPYSTASAAQPLAAEGIVVLQIGNSHESAQWEASSREAPAMQEGIEAALEHLDSLRFVDRTRVGLVGFSRTCYHVLYALTHSHHPFAAAVIADGVDMSYMQYMLFEPAAEKWGSGGADVINGGPPFGDAFHQWRERAPGFNMDRVRGAVLVQAIGPNSLLAEWEGYASLVLQRKPVEMLYLPEGTHVLVRPWERLASSQASVDWFRFWLKGEEDPDPAKAKQYVRWRELRKLQMHQPAADTASAR